MRYEKIVTFLKRTAGNYDPNTGDYGDEIVFRYKMPAVVSPMSVQTQNILFGHVASGSLTIMTQWKLDKEFDLIEIDEKKYRVESEEHYRTRSVYHVLEVPDEY